MNGEGKGRRKKIKRGATALSGVLLLDKPQGWTSHDLVAKLRAVTGEGRIGHCGTLDPDATGLMVMLVGPATKLADDFTFATKRYLARIFFGTSTTTDDAQGEVVHRSEVPTTVWSEDEAKNLLADFTGMQEQTPPDFSALKVDGKVGYREARKGKPLKQQSRRIEVYSADLREVDEAAQSWLVEFHVSRGSYIRALARDIGLAAGTHAHLSELRRISSGTFDLAQAHSIEDVAQATTDDPLAIADFFLSRETLLQSVPQERLSAASIADPRIGPCVLTIGVFDGVHPGHQALLHTIKEQAQKLGIQSAVLTFDMHPREMLTPGQAPKTLMSLEQKINAIKECGIDQVIVLPFNHRLSQQSAEDFLTLTLPTLAQVRSIIVGSNFRCGKNAECGPEEMQTIFADVDALHFASCAPSSSSRAPNRDLDATCKLCDSTVTVIKLKTDEAGIPYSSTRIREKMLDAPEPFCASMREE